MAGVCLGLNRIVHLWVLLFRAFVSLCTHAQGEVKQLVFCQSASLSLKKASSRFYSIQAILLDRFCTWHNEGNCFHYYIVSLDNALFSPNQPLLCLLSYAQALQLGWNIIHSSCPRVMTVFSPGEYNSSPYCITNDCGSRCTQVSSRVMYLLPQQVHYGKYYTRARSRG